MSEQRSATFTVPRPFKFGRKERSTVAGLVDTKQIPFIEFLIGRAQVYKWFIEIPKFDDLHPHLRKLNQQAGQTMLAMDDLGTEFRRAFKIAKQEEIDLYGQLQNLRKNLDFILSGTTARRGRKQHHAAIMLARWLSRLWYEIHGKPGGRGGNFHNLVSICVSKVGFEDDPAHLIRNANRRLLSEKTDTVTGQKRNLVPFNEVPTLRQIFLEKYKMN